MIISDVKTYYVSSKTDRRLIRYDVIKLNNDVYQVKVIDDQQHGITSPSALILLDDFPITRTEYDQQYPSGFQQSVSIDTKPTFENTITDIIQKHRDQIS
ncbi:hypothetical protein UYSO10_3921 [Kosakonia radicincitans]|uniref:hypothetical protein n=1 Tax=Kosakonia radicincitans TaxID=283686 RepID=UPI001182FB8C|nr:hypothetical protein [Kosakonia radicincitans]VVT52203.1 hypothetical protein UYSO10_3921 [Kosakonia radicincitans]